MQPDGEASANDLVIIAAVRAKPFLIHKQGRSKARESPDFQAFASLKKLH
jgi:hypothetical protein